MLTVEGGPSQFMTLWLDFVNFIKLEKWVHRFFSRGLEPWLVTLEISDRRGLGLSVPSFSRILLSMLDYS